MDTKRLEAMEPVVPEPVVVPNLRLTATAGGWRVDTERLEAMEPVVPEPKQLYPKKGDHIKYFMDGEWKKAAETSKGGRSTGKNKSYFNIKKEEGETSVVHLNKVRWEMNDEHIFKTNIVMGKEDTIKYEQVND